jgi:hypothetical protein
VGEADPCLWADAELGPGNAQGRHPYPLTTALPLSLPCFWRCPRTTFVESISEADNSCGSCVDDFSGSL